jgi:hypothetical protein
MSLTSYRAAPPRERVRGRFRAGWYLAIKTAVVKTGRQETVIVLANLS